MHTLKLITDTQVVDPLWQSTLLGKKRYQCSFFSVGAVTDNQKDDGRQMANLELNSVPSRPRAPTPRRSPTWKVYSGRIGLHAGR